MTSNTEVTGNIITKAFECWGNKWWFQTLVIIVVIYLLSAPILGPLYTSKFRQEENVVAMTEAMQTRDANKIEDHKLAFELSKQNYALAKRTMSRYLDEIDCEYMFLIEYHNGSENVVTGIQFCRFDVTLEVGRGDLTYVPLDKWKDDIVARYDILLSEELSKNKLLYYTKDQFNSIDRYLALQLEAINAQSYAILNMKDGSGKVFGSLLCVSVLNQNINQVKMYDCANELKTILTKSVTNTPSIYE